jgi:hypothetical protein
MQAHNWSSADSDTPRRMLVTAALAPFEPTFDALCVLTKAVFPAISLPMLDQSTIATCIRYVGAGPDVVTQDAILGHTVKSFLYLLHEAVEVPPLLPILNRPRKTFTRSDGAQVGTKDPWRDNWHNAHETVKAADTDARILEAHAESALFHLVFGVRASPRACAATLEVGTHPMASNPDWARDAVCDRVIQRMPGPSPQQDECDRAALARQQLYSIGLWALPSLVVSVPRTAYAIWQARGETEGFALRDWCSAEQAKKRLERVAGMIDGPR